jgi:uncharacterized protein (DUF2252 family)
MSAPATQPTEARAPAERGARRTAGRAPATRKSTARKPATSKPAARQASSRQAATGKRAAPKPATSRTAGSARSATSRPSAPRTASSGAAARKPATSAAARTSATSSGARKPATSTAARKPAAGATARKPAPSATSAGATARKPAASTAARKPAASTAARKPADRLVSAVSRPSVGRATARPARGRAGSTRTARLVMDRLDPAERAARGRAARAEVPRESHAVLDLPADRPDPVALLERQAKTRVPELVPIRYGRMLASPFSYYRGSALMMATDLAATPASGLIVQACGDAHLSNFGFFASPERRLVFDVNDFDETLPAPWEWDVKRLAASLEVAARGNGYGRKRRRDIVLAMVASYRNSMRSFAGMGNLDVWFTQTDVDQLRQRYQSQLAQGSRRRLAKGLAKATSRNNLQELGKLTTMVDGRPRITADPPLVVPVSDLVGDQMETEEIATAMSVLIGKYRQTLEEDRRVVIQQYEFTDMARKVVGVGSVGTRCWIILMMGRDGTDPLFLQVKEAEESVLSEFVGASQYSHQGQRVVAGQRLMQAASDIFLGWQRVPYGLDGRPRDFYIRSLRDWKLSIDIEVMIPRGMRTYGELCGWTLARAHARSGDRIAIGAYLGGKDVFDQAIADFAVAYADQNERDYQELSAACQSGRITAIRDI